MLEEYILDNDLIEEINDLLKLEQIINYKKEHNIKLDSKEKFFDNYLLPPSFLISMIQRRVENVKKVNGNKG